MKVALIESKPSRTDFVRYFDNEFEFDRFALCSDSTKKKILKADVDIEINTDDYDWVSTSNKSCYVNFQARGKTCMGRKQS